MDGMLPVRVLGLSLCRSIAPSLYRPKAYCAMPPLRAMPRSDGEIRRLGVGQKTGRLYRVLSLTKDLPPYDKLRLIGLLTEDLWEEPENVGEPVDMLSLVGLGAET